MAQRTNLAYRTLRACDVSIRCGICARLCAGRVLRYLKQRSIMSEGADGIYDPQTIVTLVLLAALVLGIGKSLVTGALPTAS